MSAPKKSATSTRARAEKKPAKAINSSRTKTKNSVAIASGKKTKSRNTKIVVKCNCGFPNNLYLRGEGLPGINWEKGVVLKCTKADEWVWETDKPFAKAQFKILLNDSKYEAGENHSIECGKSITFAPKF